MPNHDHVLRLIREYRQLSGEEGGLAVSAKRSKGRKRGRIQALNFLLHATFETVMKQDLNMEEEENRALRRALLALIWLVQENLSDDPSSGMAFDFIEYLLTRFDPLAGHFDAKHRHFLVRGEDVMRARLANGQVGLLIREDFGKQLLAEGLQVVMEAPEE